ncbi:hypothetical protein NDU88_002500 [Pleurodeles waltl]|uniref:Uncharacterized protein n=1 Tax=Pleurodeles waltl TaxID=8319 RepID=A0AAV7QA36_PLEWA|nr:hypothetical protein NDU88_002500 [Pleurodeles waltl]
MSKNSSLTGPRQLCSQLNVGSVWTCFSNCTSRIVAKFLFAVEIGSVAKACALDYRLDGSTDSRLFESREDSAEACSVGDFLPDFFNMAKYMLLSASRLLLVLNQHLQRGFRGQQRGVCFFF